MTTTLRICQSVFEILKSHHLEKTARVERLSFVFGRTVHTMGRTVILVPDQMPMLFDDDCFVHQSAGRVTLESSVLNGMLVDFARSDWDAIINVHDHWFSAHGTRFSAVDDADDCAFSRYMSECFEPMLARHPALGAARKIAFAAMVLDRQSLDARTVHDAGNRFQAIDQVQVMGEHMNLVRPNGSAGALNSARADERHARHADFITPVTQEAIADIRFGLVGCGGLGSIIGEGLARLGARHITLVDSDRLEATNLNRWQGAAPGDVGREKADLLASRLVAFAPDGEFVPVPAPVDDERGVAALRACDILIGAVDSDAARVMLNRIASQYLMPYFDAGTAVDLRAGVDFWLRYFLVVPGATGCLECTRSYLVDGRAAAAALGEPLGRAARQRAGYVDGAPQISAPSVYPLNLRASSVLLTELLNYLGGYRRTGMLIQERWRGEPRRLKGISEQDCPAPDCANCSYYHGRGDAEPLPSPGRDAEKRVRWIAEAGVFAATVATEDATNNSQLSTGAHHGQA